MQRYRVSANSQPALQVKNGHISNPAFIDVKVNHLLHITLTEGYMSNAVYIADGQYSPYVVSSVGARGTIYD